MAFEATKREWSELYAFFRLLADGQVALGTPQVKADEERCWPIACTACGQNRCPCSPWRAF